MNLSIILYVIKHNSNLTNLIEQLNLQSNQDFEIIAIIEGSTHAERAKLLTYFSQWKKTFKERLKFVISSHYEGPSYCYNFALTHAVGDYVLFWKPLLTIEPGFVQTINDATHKTSVRPDFITFWASNTRQLKFNGLVKLKKHLDKLEYFKKNKRILAGLNFSLHNKVFKRSILSNNQLFMEVKVNYNLLFVYRFIALSRSYYQISKPQTTNVIENTLNFSVLHLLKQWVSIYNLYNNSAECQEYLEALNYAFFYFTIQHYMNNILPNVEKKVFLRMVRKTYNPLLRRLPVFQTNMYLAESDDKEFVDRVANLRKYLGGLRGRA